MSLKKRIIMSQITVIEKEPRIYWLNTQQWSTSDLFDKLQQFATEQLLNGDADTLIQEFIESSKQKKDVQGLQSLANFLFSGERYFKTNNLTILSYLLVSDEIQIEDLSIVIQEAFIVWKQRYVKQEKNQANDNQNYEKWSGYSPGTNIDNEHVLVVSGCGLFHIQKFLKNDPKAGYQCDSFGNGIYVTPLRDKVTSIEFLDESEINHLMQGSTQTVEYANRTPLVHCDRLTFMAGFIKAKHLRKTNNCCEAVVPKGKGHKLKCVTLLVMKPKSVEELPLLRAGSVQECFPNDSELQKRLQTIINQLSKEADKQLKDNPRRWVIL
jgi:hypothetical protein